MPLSKQQEAAVEAIFIKFMTKCFKSLRGMRLESLTINPILARLVARTPSELARFVVDQRWNRTAATSMGFTLQSVAREVATVFRSSAVSGADLEADDQALRRLSLMQVKSGPDTVNKDIMDSIQAKLAEAERRVRHSGLPAGYVVVKMVGMCYGRPANRNNWVKGLGSSGFDIDSIGRAFWKTLTGDPTAYIQVFDIAARVAQTYKDGHGMTLPEVVEQTTQFLAQQIAARYSNGQGGIDWHRLLEDYM